MPRYGHNSLGQENALNYPSPKWHPYYGWGWGAGAPMQPTRMVGDPNIRPPGNWFGHPVVGSNLLGGAAFPTDKATVQMVQVGTGLLVGGAAYVATKSILSALLGGGAAALLVTILPIWRAEPEAAQRQP